MGQREGPEDEAAGFVGNLVHPSLRHNLKEIGRRDYPAEGGTALDGKEPSHQNFHWSRKALLLGAGREDLNLPTCECLMHPCGLVVSRSESQCLG